MCNINLLRKAMLDKKITVDDLATKTTIDANKLQRILSNECNLTEADAIKISEILEIVTEELLGIEMEENTDIDPEGREHRAMRLNKTVVLTIATNKGGEGKTSIVANLGYTLADRGYSVLLIDSDGQRNLGKAYGYTDRYEKNIHTAFVNKESLLNHITKTKYDGLDIILSDKLMRDIDALMISMPMAEMRMSAILREVKEINMYDFILIDTNPTLSKFNQSVLNVANFVLVPYEPGAFGIDGVANMVNYVSEASEYHPVELMGVVMNRVDMRAAISKEARQLLLNALGDKKMTTEIRQDVSVKNAQWQGIPLRAYNKYSKASKEYVELAKEVLERVGIKEN